MKLKLFSFGLLVFLAINVNGQNDSCLYPNGFLSASYGFVNPLNSSSSSLGAGFGGELAFNIPIKQSKIGFSSMVMYNSMEDLYVNPSSPYISTSRNSMVAGLFGFSFVVPGNALTFDSRFTAGGIQFIKNSGEVCYDAHMGVQLNFTPRLALNAGLDYLLIAEGGNYITLFSINGGATYNLFKPKYRYFVKTEKKDSVLRSSISLNSGIGVPIPNYPGDNMKAGPEFDLRLRMAVFSPYVGVELKAFYMSNEFKALEDWGPENLDLIQQGDVIGPSFTVPLKKFTITANLLAGLYQYEVLEVGQAFNYEYFHNNLMYDAGIKTFKYSFAKKWVVNLNVDYISTISSEVPPTQFVSITSGIGFKF